MKLILVYFLSAILYIQAQDQNIAYKNLTKENIEYKNIDSLVAGYKSNISNEIFLKAIADEYQDSVSYRKLGKTHLDNNLVAVNITNKKSDKQKFNILFNCAHHADELISTEHCYDIIYHILTNQDKYQTALDHINILVVPIVNPDGSYFFWNKSIKMGRKNGRLHDEQDENSLHRGVDLNRNYSFKWNSGHPKASSSNPYHQFYRGEKPFSEPETQTMAIMAEQMRFLFSLSFHSQASRILYPYTIENIKNVSPDYPKQFTERLAKISKTYQATKNLYPVDGTDQDYYYFKYGTIALLLESSHHNPDYKIVKSVTNHIRPVWQEILNECLYGEKIFLRIIDENGNNVEAKIEIKDFKYHNEEQFTSSPLTGLYQKMVTESKEYETIISHPHFETKKIKIQSSNNLEPQIVMLNRKS
jgi:murein tripeptide amidase MpaA